MCIRDRGKPIDPITVSAKSGGFDRQECRDFCLACACDTPAVSHYLEYIRILKEARMKNEALAAAESLIDEIQKGEDIERCQSCLLYTSSGSKALSRF